MTLAEANALLGGPHSTAVAIRAAWARRAQEVHPDTSTAMRATAATDLLKLRAARDILMANLNQSEPEFTEQACKMCKGRGRVGTGFGAECAVCHGTGQAT